MGLIEQHNYPEIAAEQARFMTQVYVWMSFGLFTTAYTGYVVSNSQPLLEMIFSGGRFVFYGLLFLELALVWGLSAGIRKMSPLMAAVMFFVYAMVNGLTFSVIFLAYTQQSIMSTFGITAGMFAGLSAFGYLTKKDLTAMGSFLFAALLGLILAMIVNLFLHNGLMQIVLSVAGVIIFSGLTAYDTQKVKALNTLGNEGTGEDMKEAVYGALTLYLDFINLFLNLLRLMGRRR